MTTAALRLQRFPTLYASALALCMLLPIRSADAAEPTPAPEDNIPGYAMDESGTPPAVSLRADALTTVKVENDGSTAATVDTLGFQGTLNLGPHTRFFGRMEVGELPGVEGTAGFTDDGYRRSGASLESDVLRQAGYDPAVTLNLKFAYGAGQQILVMERSRYRFERSGTSGVDGFDIAASVGFADDRFAVSGGVNPVSFDETYGAGRTDAVASFSMLNDHRGLSWGRSIHFIESSMQLFYDSAANLDANPLYTPLNPGEASVLGIGGTLSLEFAGIDILGFGMTEFFLMDDRSRDDILQAQWCALFDIPLLAGMEANLSGSNAMVLSDGGQGSFINFGLDVRFMLTGHFGLIGAVAATGIMDDAGASAEGGLCLAFDYFTIDAGYSDHSIGGDPRYARGAFDTAVSPNSGAPGGGVFFTIRAGN